MSEFNPTRSVVLELQDERRAMHEGYVFLDEKCMLLAGEILRELQAHDRLQLAFRALYARALDALRAAVVRHGLQGLQVHAPADLAGAAPGVTARSLMGVPLQQAAWRPEPAAPPAPALQSSPEARACQQAFGAVLARATELAAVEGNLERLSREYQRSVRRARALQDVMLPELDRTVADIEGRLEELEQEDAIWLRHGAAGG
jgi:V/A-type H+-transporting ATPase subunit D